MPPKDRKPEHPEHAHPQRKPRREGRKGWLLLGVGDDDDLPVAAGAAVRLAGHLVPDAVAAPTVGAARRAFPDGLLVGATAEGAPVTLRSLLPAEDDGDDGDDSAPTAGQLPASGLLRSGGVAGGPKRFRGVGGRPAPKRGQRPA